MKALRDNYAKAKRFYLILALPAVWLLTGAMSFLLGGLTMLVVMLFGSPEVSDPVTFKWTVVAVCFVLAVVAYLLLGRVARKKYFESRPESDPAQDSSDAIPERRWPTVRSRKKVQFVLKVALGFVAVGVVVYQLPSLMFYAPAVWGFPVLASVLLMSLSTGVMLYHRHYQHYYATRPPRWFGKEPRGSNQVKLVAACVGTIVFTTYSCYTSLLCLAWEQVLPAIRVAFWAVVGSIAFAWVVSRLSDIKWPRSEWKLEEVGDQRNTQTTKVGE